MEGFSSIIGHETVISTLMHHVDTDRVSHAYLFLGPEGVGKYLTAWSFAWERIAKDDPGAGVFYDHDSHPDLLLLSKDEGKTMVAKDQITKTLEPWLAFKPYLARFKTVIIRDAHLLSLEAANALLKTLEDPPEYAVIILVADENNLLETIVSRCRLMRFSPFPEKSIANFLIEKNPNPEAAKEAALLSQGSIGKALLFAQETELTNFWDTASGSLVKLIAGNRAEIFNLSEKTKNNPDLYIRMIELLLRDICVYHLHKAESFLLKPGYSHFWKDIDEIRIEAIVKLLPEISGLRSLLRKNVNPLAISSNMAFLLWDMFNDI